MHRSYIKHFLKGEYGNVMIGLSKIHVHCLICRSLSLSPRVLNALTMDVVLDRRSREQIVHRFYGYFAAFMVMLSEDNVRYHASHCTKDAVPDEYYAQPEVYEDRHDVVDWKVRGATSVEEAVE